MRQLGDGIFNPLRSCRTGGDDQHTEAGGRELLLEKLLGPQGFVTKQFAIYRRLAQATSFNRHGGAVSFEQEDGLLTRSSIFHGEYLVRIYADTFGSGTLADNYLPA